MYAKYEENPEQSRILRQLKDMFSTTPHWRLREICKANDWNCKLQETHDLSTFAALTIISILLFLFFYVAFV